MAGKFCSCGSLGIYEVDGVAVCGNHLHDEVKGCFGDSNEVQVVLKRLAYSRTRQRPKCLKDPGCSYWQNGICIIFKCVKE